MTKSVLNFMLIFLMFSSEVEAGTLVKKYQADQAVTYAEGHWNDGDGVCDQFVKACLNAGGVEILAGGVEPLKNALVDAGYGESVLLQLDSDGVCINKGDNIKLAEGDPIFIYCEKCGKFIHSVIAGRFDENGNVQAYAHNVPWDKFKNFGLFKHTAANGSKHEGCYKFYGVHMDDGSYEHVHNFKEDYEVEHPHNMYAKCTDTSCGVKYYLGWNAKVSSCTTCNPPVSTKPVVTAKVNGDETAIQLTWTTVYGCTGYDVYRATSLNGTYYKLNGDTPVGATKFINTSVKKGQNYYYKVVALMTSGESVSDAVSIKIEFDAGLSAPVIRVGLNPEYGKPQVKWDRVAGAIKYEVYRSEDGTNFSLVRETINISYTNTGAELGKTYYYKVRAIGETVSEFSETVRISLEEPDVMKAPVITGCINPKYGKPQIKWSEVTGAAKYEIYRSENGGAFTKTYTTRNLSYTNTGAENGKIYSYKVKAVGSKISDFSNTVEIPLVSDSIKAPVITGQINPKYGKPQIKWSSVVGAVKYEIYRSENGKTFTKTYTTRNLSYTNTGAENGKVYFYKVKAVGSKTSDFSNTVEISLVSNTIKAPVITGRINSKYGKPQIKWSSVAGATKYEIYRSENGGAFVKTYTTKNLSYTNTGAKTGSTYRYKVKAVDGITGKISEFSNSVTIQSK